VGKTKFTTFGPRTRKILEKSPSAPPLEKILLTPMVPTYRCTNRTSTLQPLTCHVVDFLNARPYLGNETLIGDVVSSESDEESTRNPNDVSTSLCAYLSKYRIPTHSNIM